MQSVGALWQRLRADLGDRTSTESRCVLALAPLLLIVNRHTVKPYVFRKLFADWRAAEAFELAAYVWWYVGATVLFLGVPLLVWRVWFGRRLRDLGGGVGEVRAARPLLPVFAAMAVVVVSIGFTSTFAQKYPLCDLARERWDAFVAYELFYGLYFFAWEFFFRGWMLTALAGSFGAGAIWIQAVPFALMHATKPLPEAIGSLPAGLFLGWVSWRSRSFLYGWLVHWGIAVLLDLTVALRYHLH